MERRLFDDYRKQTPEPRLEAQPADGPHPERDRDPGRRHRRDLCGDAGGLRAGRPSWRPGAVGVSGAVRRHGVARSELAALSTRSLLRLQRHSAEAIRREPCLVTGPGRRARRLPVRAGAASGSRAGAMGMAGAPDIRLPFKYYPVLFTSKPPRMVGGLLRVFSLLAHH